MIIVLAVIGDNEQTGRGAQRGLSCRDMKLPILLPDLPTQRFDCQSCTHCCRDLVVHLTVMDRDKIDRQNWAGKIAGPAYVRLGGDHVLNHLPGGGCVFLRDDGRCRIHAEFGGGEKPLACQLYPFTLEAEETGLRVGIRFDCPTVARSSGSSLPAHRAELARLGGQLRTQMPRQFAPDSRPVRLTPHRQLSEGELEALVRRLDEWVRNTRRSIEIRLAGIGIFVETLGEANLSAIRDERFGELVALLLGGLPSAIGEVAHLPPPDARQTALLRQAVFAYSEHITLGQARASFLSALRYRWGQLRRSRMLAAADHLPDLGGLRPIAPIRYGAIETMRCDPQFRSEDCDELMTRFVRARLLSRGAFGTAYYGWPVLDGLAALLLSISAAGWLCRYVAAGEGRPAYGIADVRRAIGIVDRTAGRARELGARSARLRIAYLRRNHGLLRLLRAYSIIPAGSIATEPLQ
jgi:lysine-N-methylase